MGTLCGRPLANHLLFGKVLFLASRVPHLAMSPVPLQGPAPAPRPPPPSPGNTGLREQADATFTAALSEIRT